MPPVTSETKSMEVESLLVEHQVEGDAASLMTPAHQRGRLLVAFTSLALLAVIAVTAKAIVPNVYEGSAQARVSDSLAQEDIVLAARPRKGADVNQVPFVGLRIKVDGRGQKDIPMKLVCRCQHSSDGVCISWDLSKDCEYRERAKAEGTHTLNLKKVRKVVFESHGVKSHTKNYIINTKSAGSLSLFTKDEFNGYSAPIGSGLRNNHEYKNTEYTFNEPAVFTAGDPGYVFYGSFEMMPGATITLTMKDGKPFDLVSFDVERLESAIHRGR